MKRDERPGSVITMDKNGLLDIIKKLQTFVLTCVPSRIRDLPSLCGAHKMDRLVGSNSQCGIEPK